MSIFQASTWTLSWLSLLGAHWLVWLLKYKHLETLYHVQWVFCVMYVYGNLLFYFLFFSLSSGILLVIKSLDPEVCTWFFSCQKAVLKNYSTTNKLLSYGKWCCRGGNWEPEGKKIKSLRSIISWDSHCIPFHYELMPI